MKRAFALLLATSVACSFESSGQGSSGNGTESGTESGTDGSAGTGGSGSATNASASASGSASASASTTGSTSSTGDPTGASASASASGTTSASASSSDSASTAGSTTDGIDCDPSLEVEVVKVENAAVAAPMQTTVSTMGEGTYAFSNVEEQGDVIFTVDIPCNGTWYLWGRVADANPGTGASDPDSYYISINGGPENTWFYGCYTANAPQWSWQRTSDGVPGTDCADLVRLEMTLPMGTHAFKFRNREGSNFAGEHAAIARIALVNNPDYMPTTE